MIQTLKPDRTGRVAILGYLHDAGWKPGQGIEVDFIKPVNLPETKKPGGIWTKYPTEKWVFAEPFEDGYYLYRTYVIYRFRYRYAVDIILQQRTAIISISLKIW